MDKVVLDENKESVVYVCSSGGGYGWGEIYYDSETQKWYEHKYHCGSVDLSEDHDDGVFETDKKYVIRTLVEKNELFTLIRFYKELDAKNLLPDILAYLQASHSDYIYIYHFLKAKHHEYYRFQNGDDAVYFSNVYYSVTNDGKSNVDYSVVDRIIKEKDTVLFSKYSFREERWVHYSLSGELLSEAEIKNLPTNSESLKQINKTDALDKGKKGLFAKLFGR